MPRKKYNGQESGAAGETIIIKSQMTKRTVSNAYAIALIIGAFALWMSIALHWAHYGKVVSFGDDAWWFNPQNFIHKRFFLWGTSDSILGRFTSGVEMFPYILLNAGLTKLLGASLGQMAVLGLGLWIGWTGLFFAVRALRFSLVVSAVAATIYCLNPWTQAFYGTNFPILWAFSTSPWILYALFVSARHREYRHIARAALTVVALIPLGVIGANPGVLLSVIALYVTGALYAAKYSRDPQHFYRWAAFTGLYMGIASLWWLLPVAADLLSAPAATATSPTDWSFVVKRSSLLNNLRLNSSWGWAFPEYYPFAHDYDASLATYASGFLLVTLACASIVTARARRSAQLPLALGIALCMLFLAKGLHPPFAWLNSAFYHIPFAFLWREPTSKAPIVALPFLAICAAVTLERLTQARFFEPQRLRRPITVSALLAIAVIAAVSANGLLRGAIFRGPTLALPSTYVSLPTYWTDAAQWLNTRANAGGVAILPEDPYYQVSYNWGYYGADTLPQDLINRSCMIFGSTTYTEDSTNASIEAEIANAIRFGDPIAITMLRRLGIRYVMYRGDVGVAANNRIDVASARSVFVKNPEIDFGPLAIFDLGLASPIAEMTDKWVAGNYVNRSAGQLFEISAASADVPRFPSQDLIHVPTPAINSLAAFENDLSYPSQSESLLSVIGPQTPLRLLWGGGNLDSTVPLSGNGHTRIIAAVVHDQIAPPAIFYNAPGSLIKGGDAEILNPVPSLVNTIIDDAATRLAIFNPARAYASTSIGVSVFTSTRGTYYLASAGGLRHLSTAVASRSAQWAHFHDVILQPGLNYLVLSFVPDQDHSEVQPVQVGDVRFATLHRLSAPYSAGNTAIRLIAGSQPHQIIKRIPVGMELGQQPSFKLTVQSDGALTEGAILELSSGSKNFDCYATLDADSLTSAKSVAESCLQRIGASFTISQISRVVLKAVDVDASLPDGVLEAEATPVVSNIVLQSRLYQPPLRAITGASMTVSGATYSLHKYGTRFNASVEMPASANAASIIGKLVHVTTQGQVLVGRVIAVRREFVAIEGHQGVVWLPTSVLRRLLVVGSPPAHVVAKIPLGNARNRGRVVVAITSPTITNASISYNGNRYPQDESTGEITKGADGEHLTFAMPLATLSTGKKADSSLIIAFDASVAPGTIALITMEAGVATRRAPIAFVQLDRARIPLSSIRSEEREIGTVKGESTLLHIQSEDPTISSAIIGPEVKAPAPTAVSLSGAYPMMAGSVVPVGSHVIVLNQAFSKTWLGFCFGKCALTPHHFEVDGWRNAWIMHGPGRFILLNVMVIAQLAALLISCGLTVSCAALAFLKRPIWRRIAGPIRYGEVQNDLV